MGRPLEFDPDLAVQAATQLFWAQGYSRTSLADLLKGTSMSRSSLYQAFGSKRQLFELCLHRYADDLEARLRASLRSASSGLAFIEQVLREVAGTAGTADGQRGCLLINTINELTAEHDASSAKVAQMGLARVVRLFASALERARELGEVTADKPPEELADYLFGVVSGLRTMVKAGYGPSATHQMVGAAMSALR